MERLEYHLRRAGQEADRAAESTCPDARSAHEALHAFHLKAAEEITDQQAQVVDLQTFLASPIG